MSTSPHVFVVSLYGKGHYIASLLSQKSYKVTLLNLQMSSSTQNLNIENLIGPFDFFENTTDSLQEAFLNSFIHFQNTASGFTLWLPSGPIDFQSFIKSYALDNCGLNAENIEYLSNVNLLSREEKNNLRTSLDQLSYSENWLSKLAHQLISSKFQLQMYSLEKTTTKALPLFNKKKIAQATYKTLNNSLEWCKANGVNVVNIDNTLSFLKQKNRIQNIHYVNTETKQEEKFSPNQIVWTLNSQETKNFYPEIFPLLYKNKLTPIWQWKKITLHFDEKYIPDFSNPSFLMINNTELNFSGDNLSIVKKTALPNVWNLWLCIPQQSPSDEAIKKAIPHFFKDRIPQLKITKINIPKHESNILFPVFDVVTNAHIKPTINLHFCNFEACSNLDWPSFLNFQKNMTKTIEKQLTRGNNDQ